MNLFCETAAFRGSNIKNDYTDDLPLGTAVYWLGYARFFENGNNMADANGGEAMSDFSTERATIYGCLYEP